MTLRTNWPRKFARTCAAVCIAALGTTGAGHAGDESAPGTARPNDTSRIISIGGDVTEIIYALGYGDKVIAVDTTSQYPREALKDKKSVGYLRALSSEGVLALNPTAIIASAAAGPPEVVKALKSSSVSYVEIGNDTSPEGVVDKINTVAKVFGAERAGEEIAQRTKNGFAALAEARQSIGKPKRVLFVLSAQNGRAIAGGSGTSADAILKLAGAENAAASFNGFKPLVDEAVIELAPDFILLMRRGDGNDGHQEILALKGVSSTPAGRENRIITMDGPYLLEFGPRSPAAARELMASLYPDAAPITGNPQPQAR